MKLGVKIAVLAGLALTACMAEDDATQADDAAEEVTDEPDVSEVSQEVVAPPHTVYVNFGGGTFTDCDACSLSASNRSWVVGTVFKKSSITLGAAFAGLPARRASIMSYLRHVYYKYNVQFVESRPASGNYTMVVVTPETIRDDLSGYSPIDCGNASRMDIAFVWNAKTSDPLYPDQLAKLVAHELGHSFGLEHVVGNAADLMLAGGRDAAHTFSTSTLLEANRCEPGNPRQDGHARLVAGLGHQTAAPPAPTGPFGGPVSWNQVWLNWSAPSSQIVAGYIVRRNGVVVSWQPNPVGPGFVDANLPESSWLAYEVFTYNYAGVWSAATKFNTFTPAGPNRATPLWRYRSTPLSDNFYTVGRNDAGYAAFSYYLGGIEGNAFAGGANGTTAVHQYWSEYYGDHFITTNWGELGGGNARWSYEGIKFYVFPVNYGGTVALHRYWNGTDHYYTKTYAPGGLYGPSSSIRYTYEGVFGYVYP